MGTVEPYAWALSQTVRGFAELGQLTESFPENTSCCVVLRHGDWKCSVVCVGKSVMFNSIRKHY
jgi:hypothetical protein